MPKQTFFNLVPEKRGRVLDVAVDEFAEHGYELSSISRIVARAGIAKGSFYQYFEDKDDLFCYIVTEMIAERKIKTYQEEKEKLEQLSLTEFLRLVFHRQVREFNEDPRLLKIGIGLIHLINEPVYRKLVRYYHPEMDSFYMPFIRYEMDQGEIDPDINPRILNFMLVSLGQYMTSLLVTGGVEAITHELIDQIVDDLEYILTNGIYLKAAK